MRGSPLGPPYANVFLCHREHNCLNNARLILNLSIIVDTSMAPCSFSNTHHTWIFLKTYLNSKHLSIKFTCEMNENNYFFLDTSLATKIVQTNIYRKPAFTRLGHHFLNCISYLCKINSIKHLITNACNSYNNWSGFHDEMIFLNEFFVTSRYPLFLFDKHTKTWE